MDANLDYMSAALRLVGSLGLLIFGMKMMSEALQKMAGPKLRHVLARMTTNRFTGMLTGVMVTAAVQSSTATTVMTVSFVNAALLTLAQAISIIMGANIGTTLTAWIMSAGLSFNITDFVWPLFIIAMFLIYKKKHETGGYFLFGMAFLLLGLGTLRQTGSDMNLGENEAVLGFFSSFDPNSMGTTLLFLLIGGVLTMCVQSSAAVMAITMILCSSGALPIYQGIALVMGENIGTTITANIAATVAGTAGKRAARAHLVFNVVGVTMMLIIFRPILMVVQHVFPDNAPMALTLFHTLFNILNVSIQSWFIPQIVWIVTKMVPDQEETPTDERYRLSYISRGPVNTAELNLQSAKQEIQLFSKQVLHMYALLPELVNAQSKRNFEETLQRIANYEQLTDQMEMELTRFLTAVGGGDISGHTSQRISSMLRIIDNLESIGDSIYQMALTRQNKRADALHFGDKLNDNLAEMYQLVEKTLMVMDANLVDYNRVDNEAAQQAEREVNNYRNQLREKHLEDLKRGVYNYEVGNAYSSLYAQYEKMADFVVNVTEAIVEQ